MHTKEDIKSLTYDISPNVSEKDEEETEMDGEEVERDEDEIDEEEEEEKENEGDEETEVDVKEETDKQDEDLEGEEEGKNIEEKGNGKEEAKDKKESPRVSLEPIERDAEINLTVISTLIKQKGKRQRQTPLYFRTRKSARTRQGNLQTPTKVPIVIEDSPK